MSLPLIWINLVNSVLSSRLARDNDKLISYSAKTCQQTNLSNAGRQPRPGPGWVQDSLSLKEFLLSAVKHSWLCLETAGPRLQTRCGINRGSGAGPGGGVVLEGRAVGTMPPTAGALPPCGGAATASARLTLLAPPRRPAPLGMPRGRAAHVLHPNVSS